MKLHTERMARREIADVWATHPVGRRYQNRADRQFQVDWLRSLGDEPTLEQIASVIGRKYANLLICLTCSECERDVTDAVEFEADSDKMESALVCLDCLQEAVKQLQADVSSE